MNDAPKPIVLHGLRRSGTTIFWETLRSDPSALCFDEPFHPRFAAGVRENHKGTWLEMATAAAAHHAPQPAAIEALEELDAETTKAQRAWLGHLVNSAPRVAIDVVRGWNRLPDLYPEGRHVVTVHLMRDPVGWVEAHLMPSGKGTWRKPLADLWRRISRYRRRGFYDNYHYQTIIETALSRSHPVMTKTALSPQELLSMSAHIRLLAFWWGANTILREGSLAAGQQPMLVTHDEFTAQPDETMAALAERAGWHDARFDTRAVRRARRSPYAQDPQWRRAVDLLGLPRELLLPEPLRGSDLAAMFEAGPAVRRGR